MNGRHTWTGRADRARGKREAILSNRRPLSSRIPLWSDFPHTNPNDKFWVCAVLAIRCRSRLDRSGQHRRRLRSSAPRTPHPPLFEGRPLPQGERRVRARRSRRSPHRRMPTPLRERAAVKRRGEGSENALPCADDPDSSTGSDSRPAGWPEERILLMEWKPFPAVGLLVLRLVVCKASLADH